MYKCIKNVNCGQNAIEWRNYMYSDTKAHVLKLLFTTWCIETCQSTKRYFVAFLFSVWEICFCTQGNCYFLKYDLMLESCDSDVADKLFCGLCWCLMVKNRKARQFLFFPSVLSYLCLHVCTTSSSLLRLARHVSSPDQW